MTSRPTTQRPASRLISCLILFGVLSGGFPVSAQLRRGPAKKPPAANNASSTAAAEETLNLTGTFPPDRAKTMGAAFQSGVLPAPSALPPGTIEEQAVALAAAVSAGDEGSTAALLTALRAAGYGVRQTGGSISFNQQGWQGIALDGWEVAALAKLYGNGYGLGLGTLGDGLSLITPAWKKETNAADIVSGIRDAAASGNESLRFWAHFIIELGRRADAPFDLRNDEDLKHARLDAVQVYLILTRLAADVNLVARRAAQTRAAVERRAPEDAQSGGGVRFIKASYRPRSETRRAAFAGANVERPATATAEDPPLPCSLGELESLILDLNATGMTTGFGALMGYLEGQGAVSDKAGAYLGAANTILIVAKFIATYAALDSEITLDGGMLTRTKTTQAGERKTLTAKVKIDVGRWQTMNCIRPALNAAGLDFSLPGNGALAGTRVDWNLVEGGNGSTTAERVWYTVKNLPGLVLDGTADNGDAIIYLDTQAGVRADDKKAYNYTDANGESKIDAVGMPQRRDLSRDRLRPVMRTMAVNLDMQIKTMRIKDATGAAGTANDLAGNVIAFFTKDIPGFAYGTAAETLYRANLGSSKTVAYPVKDWLPCNGGWHGKVTYRRTKVNEAGRTFTPTGPQRNGDGSARSYQLNSWRNFQQDEGIINIKTETDASGKLTLKAAASVLSQESRWSYGKKVTSTNCKGTQLVPVTYHHILTDGGLAFAEGEAKDFRISVYDTASIGFIFPNATGVWQKGETAWYETSCKFDAGPPTTAKYDNVIENLGYTIDDIPLDPDNPFVLKGERTIPGSKPGEGITVMWNLARCQ